MPLWNTVVVHCCSTGNRLHTEPSIHLCFIPALIIIHSFLPSCCSCHLTSFFLVPLVITRASDLLNASSVSGTAASLRRHQQGEWKAVGETCRETATADVVSYRTCYKIRSCSLVTYSQTDILKNYIKLHTILIYMEQT